MLPQAKKNGFVRKHCPECNGDNVTFCSLTPQWTYHNNCTEHCEWTPRPRLVRNEIQIVEIAKTTLQQSNELVDISPLPKTWYFNFRKLMSPEELERWKNHQNGVAPAIKDMTGEQLNEFLKKCEDTIFETKAVYQVAYQEYTLRQVEARTKSREELITNPRYEPIDSPTVPQGEGSKKKGTKKADINNFLTALGLNPGETVKEMVKKGNEKKVEKIEAARKEDVKKTEEKISQIPVVNSEICIYSHTEKHEPDINHICKWCNERIV